MSSARILVRAEKDDSEDKGCCRTLTGTCSSAVGDTEIADEGVSEGKHSCELSLGTTGVSAATYSWALSLWTESVSEATNSRKLSPWTAGVLRGYTLIGAFTLDDRCFKRLYTHWSFHSGRPI